MKIIDYDSRNTMKYLIVKMVIALVFITACGGKNNDKPTVDIQPEIGVISDLSIYNLPSKWTTHTNEEIELKELQGDVLVMVMIYTSCQAACPRLVADMRNINAQLPDSNRENVKFILVSIDPETDTPERLKAFSIENEMDDEQWLFLRSDEGATREFAAVLAVNYKKISPIDFTHSNIISVFNKKGELEHQQEGLGVDNKETIETIITLTN